MHRMHLIAIVCLIATIKTATCVSIMSLDIGNEFIKIAIVSPGKPMEIVLNSDSQRKTPLIVAFRDGERFYGEAALTTATRFPEKAFSFLLDLIGKPIDSPSVKLYQKRFPFHKITTDSTHSRLLLNHPDGMSFTPEELLAMILQKAKFFAEEAAGEGQKITDAVLTVPSFFNQAERRAILHSAQLAGLKVLQLINAYTAVALNYGIFRRKDFNESKPTNVLFYDMGSSKTTVAIASYQLLKTKERGFVETNPQVSIKGSSYDRTLGGFEMELRLRNHLAKLFAEQRNKKLESITSNKRAMNKLLKEAGRLKKILSANTEHVAQVENVMDDLDLKVPVTREDFENLCQDLLKERITNPIAAALKSSGLTPDDIDQVIPFGGNSRIPKVQEIIQNFLNQKSLSKSINSDEAAALGAAYQAAHLSKGFKVKTFLVKDANFFPIQVEFSRLAEQEGGSKQMKNVQRTLFTHNNIYPQKKVLTFARYVSDFEFFVKYGDLQNLVSEEEIHSVGKNIMNVSVTGVDEAMAKHKDKESKGVKAHFRMDESGLLHLDSVEAVFEHKVEEQVPDERGNVVGDAFAKFGETISQLFGRSKEGEGEHADNSTLEANATAPNATNINETKEAVPNVKDGNQVNSTGVNANQTKTEIKVKTVKEPLKIQVTLTHIKEISNEEFELSKQKLEELDAKDSEKLARDQSKNNLESFIHETKMKLYEKEYEQAVTEEEKEKIQNELNTVGEWLEYESDAAETKLFIEKLNGLHKVTKDMFERVREHKERPEALKALNDMLNISKIFLDGARNVTPELQIFTEVELTTLEKLITTTTKWLNESLELQSKTPLSDAPKLTLRQIEEKIGLLRREINYLINKAKITPPKKPKNEEKTKSSDEEKVENESVSTEKTESEKEEVPPFEEEEEDEDSVKDKSIEEDPQTATVKDEPHSEL